MWNVNARESSRTQRGNWLGAGCSRGGASRTLGPTPGARAQPGPAGPRSIAISFQDSAHEKAPRSGLVPEIQPRPQGWDDKGLCARVPDRAVPPVTRQPG